MKPKKSFKCKQNIVYHSKWNGCQIVTRKFADCMELPCIKDCRFSIQSYRNILSRRNKKWQNQGLSSLPLKYARQPLSKMLHRLAKNGHASRVRASAVFRFLPSPFTSTPYNLINSQLQVKAKTIFAFTTCDLPFLTRRGREIPNENAEKAVDFDQKRAHLRAKTHNDPTHFRTAVKAKVKVCVHLYLHRIDLIYCTLHK